MIEEEELKPFSKISKEINEMFRQYLIYNWTTEKNEMALLDKTLTTKDLSDFATFTNLIPNTLDSSFKDISSRWQPITTNSLLSLEILGMETRLGLVKKNRI